MRKLKFQLSEKLAVEFDPIQILILLFAVLNCVLLVYCLYEVSSLPWRNSYLLVEVKSQILDAVKVERNVSFVVAILFFLSGVVTMTVARVVWNAFSVKEATLWDYFMDGTHSLHSMINNPENLLFGGALFLVLLIASYAIFRIWHAVGLRVHVQD